MSGFHWRCPAHGYGPAQEFTGHGFFCLAKDRSRPHNVCGLQSVGPAKDPFTGELVNPDAETDHKEDDVTGKCEQCGAAYQKTSKALRCVACLEKVDAKVWYRWKKEYGLAGARKRAKGEAVEPVGPRAKRRGGWTGTKARHEAVDALVKLGNKKGAARRLVDAVPENVSSTEDIVAAALNGGKARTPAPKPPPPPPPAPVPESDRSAPAARGGSLVDRVAALEETAKLQGSALSSDVGADLKAIRKDIDSLTAGLVQLRQDVFGS